MSRADAEKTIAARVPSEIEDEQKWARLFEATTDTQWNRLAAMARRGTRAVPSSSLEELLS